MANEMANLLGLIDPKLGPAIAAMVQQEQAQRMEMAKQQASAQERAAKFSLIGSALANSMPQVPTTGRMGGRANVGNAISRSLMGIGSGLNAYGQLESMKAQNMNPQVVDTIGTTLNYANLLKGLQKQENKQVNPNLPYLVGQVGLYDNPKDLAQVKSGFSKTAQEQLGPEDAMTFMNEMQQRENALNKSEQENKAEKFKFTQASVFRGTDGRWWRWNPQTSNPEFQLNGKWTYDPNMPVPDAVPKELGRPPAASMQTGVTLDQVAGDIERINQNYNPEWVGPVAGRAYRVQEALTGLGDNNQSAFYSDVNDLADMLLRARSGAQINEQEYNRLAKLVPTPNLPPKVFQERLGRFTEQFMQAIEGWERRLGGGRYLVPERSSQTKNIVEPKQATITDKKKSSTRFTIEAVE